MLMYNSDYPIFLKCITFDQKKKRKILNLLSFLFYEINKFLIVYLFRLSMFSTYVNNNHFLNSRILIYLC